MPLYISYPANRQNNTSISRYFVCSSVDILPFFYYLALGNNSWRTNPSDMVYYLNGRESIADAIFMGNLAQQHRLALGSRAPTRTPTGKPLSRISCIPATNTQKPADPPATPSRSVPWTSR